MLALSHLAYLLALLALLCSSGPEGGLSWLLAGVPWSASVFLRVRGGDGEALDVWGSGGIGQCPALHHADRVVRALHLGMGHLGMPALWMLILALLLALLGYLVVKVLLPWRAIRRVRARGWRETMRNLGELDLNLLVVFRHLMQERSVAGTAKKLCVTPSAVSKALGKLRDWFGDPLFVRVRQGLQPTNLS